MWTKIYIFIGNKIIGLKIYRIKIIMFTKKALSKKINTYFDKIYGSTASHHPKIVYFLSSHV